MSSVMKCDRCGDYYERDGEWLVGGRQGSSFRNTYHDLCPGCAEMFRAWVKGRPEAEPKGETAELKEEIAKRDKGIERLRRRRGELVEQVRELTDRVAQLESGQRTAPRAHAVASSDVEIYRAKLGRVLDAIHEIEREVRNG